jgi:hypothetical protein
MIGVTFGLRPTLKTKRVYSCSSNLITDVTQFKFESKVECHGRTANEQNTGFKELRNESDPLPYFSCVLCLCVLLVVLERAVCLLFLRAVEQQKRRTPH